MSTSSRSMFHFPRPSSLWTSLALVLLIAGCGVPQLEYEDLEKEIGILENQLDQLAEEKVQLERANAELTEENLRYQEWTRTLSVEKTTLEEKIMLLKERLEKSSSSKAISGMRTGVRGVNSPKISSDLEEEKIMLLKERLEKDRSSREVYRDTGARGVDSPKISSDLE